MGHDPVSPTVETTDGGRRRARGVYDWSETTPAAAVVEVVAAAAERRPTELGVLYDAVDTDALNGLIGRPGADGDLSTTLVYERHRVTVRAGGEVLARPVEPA